MSIVETALSEEMQAGLLQIKDEGFGLQTMYGDGFALTGGMRVGSSPPGMMRRGYAIIDTELYQQNGGDFDKSKVGDIKLMIADGGGIIGMIDIKLNPKSRRAGTGRAVVQSLVQTAPGDFVLWDIQKKAIGFWKKMGAEFYWVNGTPVPNPAKESLTGRNLMGVIRKPGSNTPVKEIPGFSPHRF